MIRLSKLTDYGFVLLTRFASSDGSVWLTARDLSDSTGLPLPTVSKLLKLFSRNGILAAQRGVYGGYRLAHNAADITAADVIELVDGPIAITDCACEGREGPVCSIEAHCPTKPHWLRITQKIRNALADVTLLEMSKPLEVSLVNTNETNDLACKDQCSRSADAPCQCGHHGVDFSGENR